MNTMDLRELSKAPSSGWMLAYTRKEVIFEPYASLDAVREQLGEKELLELHLFNDSVEYRAVVTESPRWPDHCIEHVADFKDFPSDVYKEDVLLESPWSGKLEVLNHIRNTEGEGETGMLMIDDYRLRKIGGNAQ